METSQVGQRRYDIQCRITTKWSRRAHRPARSCRCGARLAWHVSWSPPTLQMTKESIKAIFVELEIDGKQSLAVLLVDDGLVNRLGTGAVDNTERDLFIGRANESLFAQLRDKVQPE